ncbi:hypothetical protein LX66_2922 [Chitinophaga japonensis]|uniref:Uncharacterized protein n=1 Tax=Chitinophaga japonensis TaxID=104662 RepID=A0A562T5N1_CHIJA|nr:hypothetical protein LX66_2922 [Chitinophaga japonensis]
MAAQAAARPGNARLQELFENAGMALRQAKTVNEVNTNFI